MQLNDAQKKAQEMRVNSLKKQIDNINKEISLTIEEMESLTKEKKLDAISEANYKNKIKLLKIEIYDTNEKIKTVENPSYTNRNEQIKEPVKVKPMRSGIAGEAQKQIDEYNNAQNKREKSQAFKRILEKPKAILLTAFIAVGFYGAFFYKNPHDQQAPKAPSAPKYVKKATSDLRAGITATFGQSIICSNTQIDGVWVIGCTNGATKWVFDVIHSGMPLGYEAYALNGKALALMDKPKMHPYNIKRTSHPELSSKAFNAF